MTARIKTSKSWQKHLPQKPRKVQRGYYSEHKTGTQYKKVVRIIWIILAILLIQSIFQAKYFAVDKINLQGNKDVSYDEVVESLDQPLTASKYFIFKNSNYFLLDDSSLEELLVEKYNLDEAIVDKKFPDTLNITVKEKISHFIWQKDDALYLLDAKGSLNRQISVLDDKYLILQDFRDYRPEGDEIFNSEEIEIINRIYLGWNDIVAGRVKLTRIVIPDNWDLELYTDIGFYVKLDVNQDIAGQLNNLKEVLDGNITGVDVDYIDLRFGDKVYFK